MIGDLRGRTVLLVAVPSVLAAAFEEAFVERGAGCVQSDFAQVDAALENLRRADGGLDALITGCSASSLPLASLDEYSAETLSQTITGGAWPAFACLQRARTVLGRFPRYVISLSSLAPDRFARGADFSAASEAVLETLCRYTNERLSAEDARMNILRYRLAPADEALNSGHLFATPAEVASAAVALCSGLLDSMRGQVLTVDRGGGFSDNVFRLLEERSASGK